MSEVKSANDNKEVKGFYLSISGFGTELVVGSVSDGFIEHWSKQNRNDLIEYLFDEEGRPVVGNDADIWSPWHEQDNLAHVNGPFIKSAKLDVYDDDGVHIFEQRLKNKRSPIKIDTDAEFQPSLSNDEDSMIEISHRQLHDLDYIFSSDEPFDPRQLKIGQDIVDGRAVFSSVSYRGENLDWRTWETEGGKVEVSLKPRRVG